MSIAGSIPPRVRAREDCAARGRCESYMVQKAVWEEAGMERDGGYLCIGCLERRLGRMLTPRDFTDVPINDLDPSQTKRLVSRLLGRPAA